MILNDLDRISRYIATMGDFSIPSSKQTHCGLLEDVLKAMLKMNSN